MSSFANRPTAPVPDRSVGPEAAPPRPKRRRPLFRLLWAIALLLIVAAAGYLQYRKSSADRRTAGGGGAAVASAAVSVGDLHATVRITGTLVAERSAVIRAPRIVGSRADANRGGGGGATGGGRGSSGGGSAPSSGGRADFNLSLLRLAKAGTHVKAGDMVAAFDPENQLQRLDDYKDSVVQLKNSIGRMIANLAAAKEAQAQKVRTGKADWQKALLDAKAAPVRTTIDAEKIRLNLEEADLQYKRLVEQQALVEESQRASIRASQLLLDKSAIELERAENNIKRMNMTAPLAGIVVYQTVVLNGDLRQIREGDQVSAGQPVLQIVDTGSMILNGTANQVDAERMRLGMRATVRLDAYPDLKISATLTGIGVMAKVSAFRAGYVGEIPVRLRIDGRDARLLPDLTGSAEIVLHAESDVLLAPRSAVFTENSQAFVFVQGADGWIRKEVVTGLWNATQVAVRTGLQPGEIVALQRPL